MPSPHVPEDHKTWVDAAHEVHGGSYLSAAPRVNREKESVPSPRIPVRRAMPSNQGDDWSSSREHPAVKDGLKDDKVWKQI